MKVAIATILILIAFTAPAYAQVIHQTIPGTTIRDYSAPSYVVERGSSINSLIATGGGYQPPLIDYNKVRQEALINQNLQLQNELLRQQLDALRRR